MTEELRQLLRDVKAFHDRDSGCNGFTADYEHLRLRIDEALAASPVADIRPTHRCKKRGTEYVLLGYGGMQSAHWRDPATPADNCPHGTSVNMREVAVYGSLDDGKLWVRPREEFDDGRFEAIPAAPAEARRG